MLSNDQFLNKGRYRIVGASGQDGSGGMYEAYDTVNDTKVVVRETVGSRGKVTTSSQMEAINADFMGGAKALTEIKHRALAGVRDYFADIDRQYLVLESVGACDLTKFLQPGEQRPAVAEVLAWADQLLDALQYLHTQPTPMIHGDIRPENVKLASDGTVKLLTSCPRIDHDSKQIFLAPVRSTDESGVNYRPLEQIWDSLDALSQRVILNHYDDASERWLLQPLTGATDLYSLGATLYCVLTGAPPPDALDRSIAALEGKSDPLLNPSELNTAVPAEISNVILKSMSLRREDRFYSAVILRQILHTAAVRVKEREAKEIPLLNLDIRIVDEREKDDPSAGIQSLLSAEERRLEIEAEQERLDNERRALEKRRLELDAELELQQAEQARMEREADEASRELEMQRQAAMELERVRLENKRKQREADNARELTAKTMSEKQNEAVTALLELEPIEISATSPVDLSELLDMPKDVDSREHELTRATATDDSLEFSMAAGASQSTGTKWRVPVIAAVVVLLAGGALGVWKMNSPASASASTSAAAQPINVTQKEEVPSPAVDERITLESASSPTSAPPAATTVPETATHEKNVKPVQLTAVQDKKKPAAPTIAKVTPAKKAVTVDDLINDH